MNTELPIESRYSRVDYLLETCAVEGLGSEENLLEAIVRAMSDREFHDIYLYLCRMHDIEPDIDKFQEMLREGNYDKALQGN